MVKLPRIIVMVLLVLLVLGCWFSLFASGEDKETDQYEQYKEEAENYFTRGLYQKAIDAYEAAAALGQAEEDYALLLRAYAARFEESEKVYNSYISAAKNAVKAYPENVEFTILFAELSILGEDYEAAYQSLEKAVELGIQDERISRLLFSVQYAWFEEWGSYMEVQPASYGYYAANSDAGWSYVAEDGKGAALSGLIFAGPVGQDGVRVVYDGKKGMLLDGDNVLQGILTFAPAAANAYSHGLVAISDGISYKYYNLLGDQQFGGYKDAGTFAEGVAAVCDENGWYLIDTAGNAVSQAVYTQIHLNPDGTCLKKGRMLAQKDGLYAFYDANEAPIGSFTCADADVVTDDGWIAYSDGSQWGFVDLDGNVVLEPAYQGAHSFSDGLAAVYNGETWGFINKDGVLVINYQFADALYFSEGCCMVKTEDGRWHLIKRYLKD